MSISGRILITGASGFVGTHLVRHLTATAPEATILALGGRETGAGGPDLLDAAAVADAVAAFGPTDVVHLAAASSVAQAGSNPQTTWDVNLIGLRNLAVALRGTGRPVRLIFPSSSEVYGRAFLNGPCDEDTPPQPASVYGRSKLAGEMMLRDLAGDDLTVVALRLFNHTGPGQDLRFVVPGFADQIARLEDGTATGAIRVGNLDAERDFSGIDDIIDAYTAVLSQRRTDAAFSLYNVGSGQTRTIHSILDDLRALSPLSIAVEIDQERLRPSEITVAQGLFSRFATDYGWRPTRPFDAVLQAVLDDRRQASLSGSHQGAATGDARRP